MPDVPTPTGAVDRLFDEFPAAASEEWEARIRSDLREADYDEVLVWKPAPGVVVRPYYRSADLAQLPHMLEDAAPATVTIRSAWSIQQNVRLHDPQTAERQVRDAVDGGVDRLGLDFTLAGGAGAAASRRDLVRLLEGVDLRETALHIEAGLSSLSWLDAVIQLAERRGSLPKHISASFDPLSKLARTGRFAADWLDLAVHAVKDFPEGSTRCLQAGAYVYHEGGADIVEETAFLLAAVSEYLAQLAQRGLSVERILKRLYLAVPVESTYLLEIARLRALRVLLPQVIGAYEPEAAEASIPVHASTSRRNMTLYDPHTNLLRATTEAAGAVIGGVDVLVILPFDSVDQGRSDLGYRLARNLHHLLRHEAYLDRVNDPAAGSYYVEALTDAVARAVWRAFQEIEQRGGLLRALKEGYVQEKVNRSRRRLQRAAARGHQILVGTNRFPDPDEKRVDDVTDELYEVLHAVAGPPDGRMMPEAETHRYAEPLHPFRTAEELERLRLRTERFSAANRRRPSVRVVPVGKPSESSARAHFAANFLGCAGFAIDVAPGVRALDEALADEKPADVLVLAASEAVYDAHVLHNIKQNMSAGIIGLVGVPNEELDVDFVLYRGADMVQTLGMIQHRLGMKPE